ncbi:MAG: hypothetical protein GDA50_04105 [Alphaproteobacteria bacterium GM202ARS2]|nr:hypothetical protein [Alphaproteobacteria bacterium GM202ARS2]
MSDADVSDVDLKVRQFQAKILAGCGRQLIDLSFRMLLGKVLTTWDQKNIALMQRDIKEATAVLHAIERNAYGECGPETIETERS